MTVGSKFKKFASYEDETRDIIPFRNWSVLRKETHMSKIILKYAFWGKKSLFIRMSGSPTMDFSPTNTYFFYYSKNITALKSKFLLKITFC